MTSKNKQSAGFDGITLFEPVTVIIIRDRLIYGHVQTTSVSTTTTPTTFQIFSNLLGSKISVIIFELGVNITNIFDKKTPYLSNEQVSSILLHSRIGWI